VKILDKVSRKLRLWRARLVAFWVSNLKRKPIWYTDQFGITSQLRPGENIVYTVFVDSHFDDVGVVLLLKGYLKPGMIVVDVGANKGDFSLLAAKMVSPSGSVFAIEPVDYTYQYLRENIARSYPGSDVIRTFQLAAYNEDSEVQINIFPNNFFSWNTLGKPIMKSNGHEVTPTQTETVLAKRLDSFCDEHHIDRINLLKIDVEGFEAEVFAGASKLVQSQTIDAIVFEISKAPLEGTQKTPRDVMKAFMNEGFVVSLILQNGDLETIADSEHFSYPYFANYFAVRPNSI
jgi:FkbM family methyltransferase